MRIARATILSLLVLLHHGAVGVLGSGHGNIYQGLWGGLFAKQTQSNHSSLLSNLQTALDSWKTGSEGSLLEALRRHVADELSSADAKTLAAAAVALQGWALASLVKAQAARKQPVDGSSASPPRPASLTSSLALLKYPMPIPDVQWSAFEPALCIRLQNFGGGVGYHDAYLAMGPCSSKPGTSTDGSSSSTTPAPVTADSLVWGSAARFSLDCTVLSCADPNADCGDGDRGSGNDIKDDAVEPDAGASSGSWLGSALAALNHRRRCTLGVATGAGSGTVLSAGTDLQALGSGELSALSVQTCNGALGLPGTAVMPDPAADFLLRGLKLNGRPLLPPDGWPARSDTGPGACVSRLYYVSPRALASGWTLDGGLELPAGSWPLGTGLGPAASLEIRLGEYHLVSAATAYLQKGLGAGQRPPSAGMAAPPPADERGSGGFYEGA